MKIDTSPKQANYDVVIIGGAMMGASVAWFLTREPGFDGSVLVVERDPGFASSSTAHSNSCIRQQFTQAANVQVSQFGAKYIRNFRQHMGDDPDVPEIHLQPFGYMYLASTDKGEKVLREAQKMQADQGAGTRILSPEDLAAEFPFYNLDGIRIGSHNPVDEGYFDAGCMFDWWRRKARAGGVEFVNNEVTGLSREGRRITGVELADGTRIGAGHVVNAAGPRAGLVATMAGITMPVEPRKRYTFVFEAARPLPVDLPLTVDPSGVHVRSDGRNYMAGCPPHSDPAVDPDDFIADHSLWEEKVWPAIAERIPQFDALRLIQSWVGHYAYNTLDQNAIVGPHPDVPNFLLINGFSGHGLQQAPAMGRGVAEWIASGRFVTLDLTPFSFDRIPAGQPLLEQAVI